MRNTQGFLPDPYFELTGFREEAISEKARGQGTRNVHSVPETPSYGTELTLGAQNSLLWYATRFQRHSVQKTGIYGTEGKFGAKKRLLVYGGDIRYRREPSSAPDAASKARNSLLLYRTQLQKRKNSLRSEAGKHKRGRPKSILFTLLRTS